MNFIKELFAFTTVNEIKKINTLANQVYEVNCEDQTYFLKIFDSQEEVQNGRKLAKLYPFLEKNEIPVPKVIAFAKHEEKPYLILTKVKGTELRYALPEMTTKEKPDFYFDFGKNLAKIHSITFSQFGETIDGKTVSPYIEANNKGPFQTWKEMHKELIEYRLNILQNTFFEDLIPPIRTWFEKYSHLIDYKVTPRLLHIDLNQKNMFVTDSKITGIIDFDGSFIGHNEEELMRIENAHFVDDEDLRNIFLKGYTSILPLDEGYEKRREFYYFSRLLVHMNCLVMFKENYVADVKAEEQKIRDDIKKRYLIEY